jgi:hypothetical protein
MKFGIVGTRTFEDYQFFVKNVSLFYISEIHTGDARGTDYLARKYAEEKNLPLTVHCANWDFWGKAAGPIRNIDLINHVDMILAFWDGKSPGTKQVIEYCMKHKKAFMVISLPASRIPGPSGEIKGIKVPK